MTAMGMFGFAAILPAIGAPVVNAQDPCFPTFADPATLNQLDLYMLGKQYYFEERNSTVPNSPPVMGSGEMPGGDGTWIYEETNGLDNLQRGGTGIAGGKDSVTDENCGHGPDRLVGRAAVGHLELGVLATFFRVTPGAPIMAFGTPACVFMIGLDTASANCGVGSPASCVSPTAVAVAVDGTVRGRTSCTGSGTAEATAQPVPNPLSGLTTPGMDVRRIDGNFTFPFDCAVEFSPGATGSVSCMAG